MNFDLSEEQIMIRDAARNYAQRELWTDVIHRDTHAIFPENHIKNLGKLGFLGMMVDPAWDGGGMDTVSYVLAIEEFSKVDSSIGVILSVTNSLVCYGIQKYGTEEQKETWLKPFCPWRQNRSFPFIRT